MDYRRPGSTGQKVASLSHRHGQAVARPATTAPIIGANCVEQLRETLAAGELRLDPEAIQALDAAGDWRVG